MSLKGKDLANEFYDAVLITLGAVGVSYVGRKITKDGLGIPSTPQGIAKLTVAFGTGALAVQYLQTKKLISDDPFNIS